ncbi:MAG: hypothetical protein VR70_11005 [Rhodospirillaceae bacterium BRH_c57]|nr:MAG: hypothetical protein VR70_11005 [Rhodospirillaceae bacterium BRH_c57]
MIGKLKRGSTKGRKIASLVFTMAVTLAYLWLELSYNGTLFAVAVDTSFPREDIEALSWVGKGLASFGLAWFLFGWMAKSLKGAALFGLAWIIVFGSVAWGYDNVIAGLPTDVKESGRVVALHRGLVLEGKVGDPWIAPGGKIDRIAAANAAFSLADAEAALRVASSSGGMIEEKLRDLDFGAERIRTAYPKTWDKLKHAHQDFVYWSYEMSLPPSERSVRARAAGDSLRSEFLKRTGGVEPDVDATLERFTYEIAPQSQTEDGRRLREEFFKKSIKMADGSVLSLGDLPPAMTMEDLDAWIAERLVRPWGLKAGKDPEAWAVTKDAKDVASAIFVPPISMGLSQVSILLNLAKSLAILWAMWGVLETGRGRLLMPTATASLLVGLSIYAVMPETAWGGSAEAARIEASADASLGGWGVAWRHSAALQRAMDDAGLDTGVNIAKVARRLWMEADRAAAEVVVAK